MQKTINYPSIATVFAALLWIATTTHAANISSFTTLREELVSRTGVLTGSVDKVELKQGKTCVKAIATLDKSVTLAGDIKAGSKVAKSLLKAFPTEFGVVLTAVFTNNLQTLLIAGYDNMGGQVEDLISALQLSINALPSGSDKTNAQAALDVAKAALEAAAAATDFATGSKLLATTLKDIAKTQKIVDKAGSGGGGGGSNSTFEADVIIGGGTNDHFVATLLGEPNYTVASSTLDLNGSRGTFIQGDDVTAALCGSFNGAPGTYPLGGCGGYFMYGTPNASYTTVTGTVFIATFQTTIGGGSTNATTSGTFAFTATDGLTTVVVTNGVFNLSNVLVFP
ncbi:MAG: hypothetical protein WCS70_16485 [Verrucomicrobiota bacterium]